MKNLQKTLGQQQQLQSLPEQKHNKSIKAATPASINNKTVYNNLDKKRKHKSRNF